MAAAREEHINLPAIPNVNAQPAVHVNNQAEAEAVPESIDPTSFYQYDMPGLIHLIRFRVFKDKSEDDLKKELCRFAYCDYKSDSDALCEILNAKDYDAFLQFIEEHYEDPETKMQALSQIPDLSISDVVIKDITVIMDLFYGHDDPEKAYNVISYLFEVHFDSQEEYN